MFEPYATERASALRGLISTELQRLSDHYGFIPIDNVVFTRSGIGNLQPWVLMRLPEMARSVQTAGALQTVIHHRRRS